jgi:exopolysaccharide biosynthesis polyprenyl glycosylphosphotransferase
MIRKTGVPVPASIVVLLLSELVLLTFCYVLAGYLVLEVDPSTYLLYDGGMARILVVVLAIVVYLHLIDLYAEIRSVSRVALVLKILQSIGVAFLVEALLSYVDRNWRLPLHVMIWGSVLAVVTLSAWRLTYWHIFLRAFAKERILFVGTNPEIEEASEEFAKRPELGYTNLGYLDDYREPGSLLNGAKVLGPLKSLREIAAATEPDRIVVGMTERRARMPMQDLLDLRFSGIPIEEAAAIHGDACRRVCTRELRPAQLIFSGEMGPRRGMVVLQWFYSAALALTSALVLLPVMALAALAVKLSSRGPVLFRQARVGRNGKVFTLYKFRSMYTNAEAQTGAVWASKDDPRVTPVGRWLRRTRIDELPQLWNVLHGDMSVVGPRPERPEFVKVLAEKIPYYRQRHCVKPGITGWAQINHKYSDSVEDTITKLEFDLYYIKQISPALDIYILFQTLKTVLRFRGAQ